MFEELNSPQLIVINNKKYYYVCNYFFVLIHVQVSKFFQLLSEVVFCGFDKKHFFRLERNTQQLQFQSPSNILFTLISVKIIAGKK